MGTPQLEKRCQKGRPGSDSRRLRQGPALLRERALPTLGPTSCLSGPECPARPLAQGLPCGQCCTDRGGPSCPSPSSPSPGRGLASAPRYRWWAGPQDRGCAPDLQWELSSPGGVSPRLLDDHQEVWGQRTGHHPAHSTQVHTPGDPPQWVRPRAPPQPLRRGPPVGWPSSRGQSSAQSQGLQLALGREWLDSLTSGKVL